MRSEKRRSPRVRCRLDCTLRSGGRVVQGTVRDVSAGGLAVQADLDASEGESVRASVVPPAGAPVEVDAIVWHAHRIRSRTTGATGFLLGLVISNPPDAWFDRVGALRPAAAPDTRAQPASPQCCEAGGRSTFVVRLKQAASPRTRTYRLEAASLEDARARAQTDLAEGWRVIEVREA